MSQLWCIVQPMRGCGRGWDRFYMEIIKYGIAHVK
uniref:Uncharacterized protein n=1 Tax=Anguilla anguilla TaxID=7936 RepID=A0A0E9TBY7_ANGAN